MDAATLWNISIPVLATLCGHVWRSAARRAEQSEERVRELEERLGQVEVLIARLDVTVGSLQP